MLSNSRARAWKLVQKYVSGGAAAALLAGMLVVAGVGVQGALAAEPAPEVSLNPTATYLSGEDLTLRVGINSNPAAGDQFNVSAAIVMPKGIEIIDAGTLGTPKVHDENTVLPGNSQSTDAQCVALGLEAVTPGQTSGRCRVPAGSQYVVFENISDLPDGAETSHLLTVRPNAQLFAVGSTIDFKATAFTSSEERHLPLFPGSTGTAGGLSATSDPGVPSPDRVTEVAVNALRIEKSEPSPENELLRGVHENTTTYTLRVWHTGEGDLSNVTVTDMIPAGLEYLGLGQQDHTTNANGTQGGGSDSREYPGAPRLTTTPAPNDSLYSSTSRPADHELSRNAAGVGERVETVLENGEVFTKVTWNIGALAAAGLVDYSIADPDAQAFPDGEGRAGFFEIRYRAAVPLFENTLDFDGAGGQPTADNGIDQIANLDNNRGASTRHGDPEAPDAAGNATSYRNTATASGSYAGRVVSDDDSHDIDAVDLRMLKSVDSTTFNQTGIARYTLTIGRSEYTTATIPGPGQRPYRMVDDLANGLCPVFPTGTPVADGASSQGAGIPNLVLGDPATSGATRNHTVADWNTALAASGVELDCQWNPSTSTVDSADDLEGARLIGIAFDSTTGHFYLDFEMLPTDALVQNREHQIRYSVRQNETYLGAGEEGMTTSGDVVSNHAEIYGSTQSIAALDGVESAEGHPAYGTWNAWDDSVETLRAELTTLQKHVLTREAGVPEPSEIATAPSASDWVKRADTPFAVGDEVWYRIRVVSPAGTDVRNPKLTDYLPVGTEFDSTDADSNGIADNMWIGLTNRTGLGSCTANSDNNWVRQFVGMPTVEGNALIFNLGKRGSECGIDSDDRFLPLDTELTIYIKVRVTDQAAFGEVDLPQNLAKYQQNNVDGEIHFIRSDAEFVRDQGVRLIKGVESIQGFPVDGNPVNSNVDGGEAVQGQQVKFRLDVTAPSTTTSDYVIYDALPNGIRAADLLDYDSVTHAFDASAATWAGSAVGAPLSYTARAYDWDDAALQGLHLDPEYTGRSIIVWDVTGSVPGSSLGNDPSVPAVSRGLTLGYTVVTPSGVAGGGDAAQLTQRYDNVASISEFKVENNGTGASATIVPLRDAAQATVPNGGGSGTSVPVSNRPLAAGEFGVAADLATDPSHFSLPGVLMAKRLYATEIQGATAVDDPQNSQAIIVQGEYAEFDLSVNIPAHTTVKNAVLRDDGKLRWTSNPNGGSPASGEIDYTLVDATVRAPGALPSGFVLDWDGAAMAGTGALNFAPTYTNESDDPVTFTVRLKVWIEDRDESNPSHTPNFGDGAVLTNTGRFTYDDPNSLDPANPGRIGTSDTENVTYREPNLTIAKTADKTTNVAIGDTVTYRIAVSNPNRVKSYDNVVIDTMPAGLQLQPSSFKIGATPVYANATVLTGNGMSYDSGTTNGTGGAITWDSAAGELAQLREVPSTVYLFYQAQVSNTAGAGESYRNDVKVTGYTLPSSLDSSATTRRGDRSATSSETVTAVTAALAKGVKIKDDASGSYGGSVSAPIGETVEYLVQATLEPKINYYNVQIEDTFTGSGIATPVRTLVSGPTALPADSVPGTWSRSTSGLKDTWTISGGHIAASDDRRTVTIVYSVKLTDAITANQLGNAAKLSWTQSSDAQSTRSSTTDSTAQVNILNPALNIAKTVKFSDEADSSYRESAEGNPDRTLTYRVVVSNTAGTAAHHVVAVDCVPAGLVVDQSSLGGGVFSPTAPGCPGGQITWTNLGPIAVGGSQTLTYNASFAAASNFTSNSAGVGSPTQTNTASVTGYASFDTDGRVYTPGANGQPPISATANSLPLFPSVTLAKSVTSGDIAYADTPFGWTLRVTNNGKGAMQNVSLTDTLPVNWSYTSSVTPQIRLNGTGNWIDLPSPSITQAQTQTLDWRTGFIRNSLQDADVIDAQEPVLAGHSGSGAAPYLEVRFSATPSQAALTTAGVTLGNGTRVPHTNTLQATASDTRGDYGNGPGGSSHYVVNYGTADAFIHSADLAITKVGASAPIHAGSTNVLGWTIGVTNNGPDTAVGTSAEPIKVTDLTGDLPAGVTVSSVTGAGWSCTAPTRDANGATEFECARTNPAETLASGASFPSIAVNVTVAANQPNVAANTIVNTATVVPGITHDPNLDNNESSDDIVIDTLADLTIVKAVVNPAPVNVGDSITWQVKAWNAGPSVSRADATHPLTVTDTIPAGVAGVTASGTANWVPTATRGGVPISDLTTLQAGDVVTWTYQGTQLPVGTQASAEALTLSGSILTSHTGTIANTATVTPRITPEPTTNPLPNSSTVTVTPGSETRIDVTKERVVSDGNGGWRSVTADDEFVAGTDISYRMTVVNNGPADARNVRVVDEVPAGLSYSAKADVSGSWTRSAGGTTSTGGPTATWDTFTLSGTLPATAPDHTRQFVVNYSTLPTVSASFTNCVEAATDNWVASDANRFDRACNDSASTRVVDLGIEKTHTGAGPFNAGTSVPYTITVTNHGPSASDGPITITDQLPLGMSYDSTVAATVSVAGGSATEITPTIDAVTSRLLTWQVPIATALNPNETIVVTLSAHIDQRVAGSVVLRNTATVTGVENEPDPTDPGTHPNTTTDEITTRTDAALTIDKTVQPGPWVAGKTIEYTLDVTNAGPSAVAASVTDVLPAGLTLVSMSGTDWNCGAVVAGSSTGTCTYLNAADTNTVTQLLHPVGDSTITVIARIAANVPPTAALPAAGLTNTATVNWSDTDGPGSYSDTEEIRVTTDADLSIVKSVITEAGGTVVADPAPETAGETVWYRLQVRNLGASDAVGPVTVTDTLPLGVTVPTTPTSVNGWVMTPGAVTQGQPQEVVFTLAGGLVADTAAAPDRGIAPVIEFEANLDSAIADGTVLVNSAAVESTTADSNPANNIDDAEIEVVRSADLEIAKWHPVADDGDRVVVGEALPFTIDVTNHGPSVSSGFEITDTMPVGFEVTSGLGPVRDADNQLTGWTIDSISAWDETQPTTIVASYVGVTAVGGKVPSLVIDTLVHEQAFSETDGVADEVTNHVEITDANEADPVDPNNEFDDPIVVQPVVTLVIEKTAVGEFKVGKAGTYSITVENLGPHTDLGPITVTDQLPAGLSFRESPKLPEGATVTHESGLVTWTLEKPLGVGEKVELMLVVNVGQAAYDQPNHEITNTAVVDSESQLTEDSVLTDDAVVKVKPVDPLVVTGGDLAGGLLAAIAMLVLLGGGVYVAGRRRQRARHA